MWASLVRVIVRFNAKKQFYTMVLENVPQFAAESSTESVPLRSDGHQVTITQCGSVKSNICNSGNERRSKDINWSKPSHGWNSNRFYCFFSPQKKTGYFWHLQGQLNFTEPHLGWLTFSVFFVCTCDFTKWSYLVQKEVRQGSDSSLRGFFW